MNTIKDTVRSLRGDGHGLTLLTVATGWLLISGFRVVLPALLPQIKADFMIDNATAGFAITILWVMYAGLQFPAGVVADRIGERTLLIGGIFLGSLSLGSFYVAPFFKLFLVACAVFGIGAGLFGTPRDMLLSKTYPRADSMAYGVTFAAGSLGAAILPVITTLIANQLSWQISIITLLPVFLLVVIGLWQFVPETKTTRSEIDRLTAMQTVRKTVGALSNRSILLAGSGMLLFIFTYQAMIAFLPTYLIEIKDVNQSVTAILFGLVFVFGALVQSFSGYLADYYGERSTVMWLVVLSAVTLFILPFIDGLYVLSIIVPLLGIRIAIGPLTSAYIVRELPETVQGAGWGLLRTVFFGIGATGSTVLGFFADAGLFDEGFLVLAGLTASIFVAWLFVPSTSVSGEAV